MYGAWPDPTKYFNKEDGFMGIPLMIKEELDSDTLEISDWVYQEKIKVLFANHQHSWYASILVSFLIASFSFQSEYIIMGLLWWLVFVAITLMRVRLTKKFCQTPVSSRDYKKSHKYFFWMTLFSGVAWGMGGLLVGSPLSEINQLIILLILIGVCSAAVPMLGILQDVMLGFQIPTVVPYFALLAYNMEDKAVVLLVILAIYMVGVIVAMRRVESCLSKSFRVQYRMEKMTDFLHSSNQELQDENIKLGHMSLEDSLTKLHNRRYFEMQLEKEWKRAERQKSKLTMLVIDVDYFKLFNDTYGHAEGDSCLKLIAQQLKNSVMLPGDIVARIGGEEFVALLPEIDEAGALTVADIMKKKLQQAKLPHSESLVSEYVTVSIGMVSTYPGQNVSAMGLFNAADKALYRAKEKGRNQLVIGQLEALMH